MAATSQSGQSRRGSSSRGRAQATKRAGSSASGSTSKNGTSRTGANSKSGSSKNGTSKSRSGGSTAAKRATSATKTAASKATPSGGSSNGNEKSANGHNGQHEVLTNLGVSVFSAAVGAVGGALLTRKTKHQRKVLGIPMPAMPQKVDLSGVADQIGQAGKSFGELAGEVKAVRQKAEQIGRLLS